MIRPTYSTLPQRVKTDYNTPETLAVEQDYVENVLKNDLNTSDDAYTLDLIKIATVDSEKFTCRAFINRDITVYFGFVNKRFTLPVANYNSMVSVESIDEETGTLTAITAYNVIDQGDYITIVLDVVLNCSLKVVYNAGYGATYADMPTWVRDAISQRVKYKYSNDFNEVMLAQGRFMNAESSNMFIYFQDRNTNHDYGNYIFPTSY